MSTSTALLLGLLLLLGNAFFVGAEFAVMSARRSQIEPRAHEGHRAAKTTLTAMENVSLMLACCQLGITVCSLGLGAIAEPALAHLLEVPFEAVGMPETLLHPLAFAIALTIVVYLHVVVGEMVPKNIAIAAPERSALLLATPLVWVARLVKPVITVLNGAANRTLRAFGVDPKDEVTSTFTVEQVQSIVHESRREGLIEHGGVLVGALEFSDRKASDVMVAAESLVTVPARCTPAQLEKQVVQTGFSRFPVLDATGGLSGYLHLKDVLYEEDERYEQPVPPQTIRPFEVVRAEDEVEDVLGAMQRSGLHLGHVLGADGTTVGVVFLEDVLEELVGEIRDLNRRANLPSTP